MHLVLCATEIGCERGERWGGLGKRSTATRGRYFDRANDHSLHVFVSSLLHNNVPTLPDPLSNG